MKITITIESSGEEFRVESGAAEPPVTIDGPSALVEHANHDSTPRTLGFSAMPAPEVEDVTQ
ncbi:hypothetical protein [Schaalia sp. lx-100]|uniref:hypothetical protein n=1 Tax=Schaalia sp. lx-100 TaxID=2899081 RepID=UPI001E621689|nr:hypothetical protein [Schaalia sp. lx-100]MCD4557186.1 hypothetical protein [Schaalia sp. lx-100]